MEDSRIDAAMLMSPSPARNGADSTVAFGEIRIPVLHLTGTDDQNPLGDFQAADRTQPFEFMQSAPAYLLVFQDGTHQVFSGHQRRLRQAEPDPRFHNAIRHLSLAFWDAWLKDDEAAREWLKQAPEELTDDLTEDDVWKVKTRALVSRVDE